MEEEKKTAGPKKPSPNLNHLAPMSLMRTERTRLFRQYNEETVYPPICSWWTSRVSPSAISSWMNVSASLYGKGREKCRNTYRVWGILRANSRAIEQEADCRHLLALALAKCVHQLFQLRRALDLEEDLVVVIGHLDVEVVVARGSCLGWGVGSRRFRHGDNERISESRTNAMAVESCSFANELSSKMDS